MKNMWRFLKDKIESSVDASGLSIFRILFSLNLFFEVLRIYDYKELYFDPIPFLVPHNNSLIGLILIVWMLCLFLMTIGLFTRISSIISYILTVYFIHGNGAYEYHMNYIYLGIGFLMIFMPMSNKFAVSNLLFNDKSNIRVSKYNYFMLLYVGVSLVYFGSVFFKLKSEAWQSGLGIWLPSSIPQVVINNFQFILNQEFIIKSFGYTALIFEIVFPFIFFFKKTRWLLFTIGVCMHLGILFLYPIPNFALGYVALYILIIPLKFWRLIEIKIRTVLNLKAYQVSTFYKNNLNYKLVIFLFITFTFLQLNATFNFPLSERIVRYVSTHKTVSSSTLQSVKTVKRFLNRNSTHYLGLTGHSVFLDGHYIGFDKVFNVSYKGQLLPMYTNEGMCDKYLQAGSWANFNFAVNGPFVEEKYAKLKAGLIRYAAFWAHKNDVDLDKAEFDVILKKVRVNFNWEKDLLSKNLATPWETVGKIIWKDKKAKVVLEDVVNE